jgi:toxin ParE1/3/4
VLLARRFTAAVVEAAGHVVRRPLLGHQRLELLPNPFRFRRVGGFPYLLVYNAVRPTPVILRVRHMARDLDPLLADLRPIADSETSETR